jgi:hypothetical protein
MTFARLKKIDLSNTSNAADFLHSCAAMVKKNLRNSDRKNALLNILTQKKNGKPNNRSKFKTFLNALNETDDQTTISDIDTLVENQFPELIVPLCAICQDAECPDKFITLTCGLGRHCLHSRCLLNLFAHSYENKNEYKCPTCRATIIPEEVGITQKEIEDAYSAVKYGYSIAQRMNGQMDMDQ